MKKFKTTLHHLHASAIISIIELLTLNVEQPSPDQSLFIAALNEVTTKIKTKQVVFKKEYKYGFSAVQALALRVLWEDYILPQASDKSNDFINRMHQLNLEIIKTFGL
ncbi:MAG: hypothetical protein JST21_00835 [Bacteroidetes bacterium]|nr:hypothetical protein [Bacteroidota bacterium]